MPTEDGFDPAHPLPQFLADQTEQGMENAFDGAVTASRVFKASILIAIAAAAGIAVLAVENPGALLAEVSASLVGSSSPQSTATIQSAADAPASIPSTADAASETAGREPAEKRQSSSESLFGQFQAWAAEQDAQAHGGPVQPVQDAPAQVVQNAPARDAENAPAPAAENAPAPAAENVPAAAAENVRAPHRLVQKRRQVRAVHNARAEMRTQNLRKQVRRAERARAERPPVQAERPPIQDARAQDTSVQYAPPLPFLFGQRN